MSLALSLSCFQKAKRSNSQILSHQTSLNLNESAFTNRGFLNQNQNSQRLKKNPSEGKNLIRNIMQSGSARPPTTVIKPFELSKSNLRQRNSFREEPKKPTPVKRSKSPISTKGFIVYRSDKPLTVPQEFKLSARNKENTKPPAKPSKKGDLGDILKNLRAKSAQRPVNKAQVEQEHSLLIKKYKDPSDRNPLQGRRNSQMK